MNAIEKLHQLRAVRPGRMIVEQLQLRHVGTCEVIQHYPGFGIPVAILTDILQSRGGSRNNVTRVPDRGSIYAFAEGSPGSWRAPHETVSALWRSAGLILPTFS